MLVLNDIIFIQIKIHVSPQSPMRVSDNTNVVLECLLLLSASKVAIAWLSSMRTNGSTSFSFLLSWPGLFSSSFFRRSIPLRGLLACMLVLMLPRKMTIDLVHPASESNYPGSNRKHNTQVVYPQCSRQLSQATQNEERYFWQEKLLHLFPMSPERSRAQRQCHVASNL